MAYDSHGLSVDDFGKVVQVEDAGPFNSTGNSWSAEKTWTGAISVPSGEVWLVRAFFAHFQTKDGDGSWSHDGRFKVDVEDITGTMEGTNGSTSYETLEKDGVVNKVLEGGSNYDVVFQAIDEDTADAGEAKDLRLTLVIDRYLE